MSFIWLREYFLASFFLAKIKISNKYQGSFLGIFWSMIGPSVNIAILGFVFSHILIRPIPNFILYLFSVVVVWNFMSTTITSSTKVFIQKAKVLKRNNISKTMFVLSECIAQFLIFCICFYSMYFVVSWYVGFFTPFIFLTPIYLMPIFFFVFFSSLLFAYISPFAQDLSYLLQIFFRTAYWALPIIYTVTMLPERFQKFIIYNPFYVLIYPIRKLLYERSLPSFSETMAPWFISLFVAVFAYFAWKKLKDKIIFYL